MDITGRGIIILNCNGTMNYFCWKDKYELSDMLSKFYVKQGIRDITVIDCKSKNVYWVEDDEDFENIFYEEWL